MTYEFSFKEMSPACKAIMEAVKLRGEFLTLVVAHGTDEEKREALQAFRLASENIHVQTYLKQYPCFFDGVDAQFKSRLARMRDSLTRTGWKKGAQSECIGYMTTEIIIAMQKEILDTHK